MARKFFLVAAGMFLLALSYHFGVSTAGASGAAATAGLAAPTEVAMLTGVLTNGGVIPLPTYADGTTALESECQWIVSLPFFTNAADSWCFTESTLHGMRDVGSTRYDNPTFYSMHPGRVINVGGSQEAYNASYLIIATRGASLPTSTLHQSWGQVKALYHPTPGMTVTPGANDK
jgi:hypothetical protein